MFLNVNMPLSLTCLFQAKYYQKVEADRARILPYIQSESDLQSLVHNHKPLPHSKTELNLTENGAVANNVFLDNLQREYESVTLIPASTGTYDSHQNKDKLYSRSSHAVYHV